jgi:hypothetical protein
LVSTSPYERVQKHAKRSEARALRRNEDGHGDDLSAKPQWIACYESRDENWRKQHGAARQHPDID